jgi:hypothetical protein
MMAFRDDGLGDWVEEALNDDVSGDRIDEDGLDNYGFDDYGIDHDGLPDDVDDDGIDGEGELRYKMLLAQNRQKLEYAGAKMIISMMVSMMAFRDDGLGDWVEEGLNDDVSGDRIDEDGLDDYGIDHDDDVPNDVDDDVIDPASMMMVSMTVSADGIDDDLSLIERCSKRCHIMRSVSSNRTDRQPLRG